MNTLNREKIHEIVELFYQPTSKTFYVNSVDGKTFIKPIGIFVSLGITTSRNVFEELRNTLKDYGYNVIIAEITSKKVSGQYLNMLSSKEPMQYEIKEFGNNIYDEEKAKSLLQEKKELLLNLLKGDSKENHMDLFVGISKLRELVDKLDKSKGWGSHAIQEESENNFKIFHKFVNYKKIGDTEYRIGLYVTEA